MSRTSILSFPDDDTLRELVKDSSNIAELARKLGIVYTNTRFKRKLKSKILQLNLDISHFRKKGKYTEEQFIKAIKNSHNLSEVFRTLGLTEDTYTRRRFNKKVKEMGLDISHFTRLSFSKEQFLEAVKNSISVTQVGLKLDHRPGNAWANTFKRCKERFEANTEHFLYHKGRKFEKGNLGPKYLEKPLSDYLIKGKVLYTPGVKKKLIKLGILKEICSCCGLLPVWENKKLVLQLDHIDGDRTNNLLENLRLLCPNCHSQTSTYSGRNHSKEIREIRAK